MTPVTVEREGPVAVIELNQPHRLNALNAEMRRALLDTLRSLAADASVRSIVLRGAGRAFCVGQDLAEESELERAEETVAATYNPVAAEIMAMPQPVIAAVGGPAIGAGLGLLLACDVRIAAATASFSAAFVKVGLVPDTGVSWHLVHELGYARAFELLAIGRTFDAAEASALGLLTEVVPAEELRERVREYATTLAAGPATALRLTKHQLHAAAALDLSATMAMEARHQGTAARHDDHREGRAAFTERRVPRWS